MTRTVLLHGALGSAAQLTELASLLPGEVCAPDLDGHGSRPAAPHTLDAFVATALAGQGDVDLVGYSLGGYVALAAAIALPDRVRRVVTVATKLAWTPELAEKESRRLDHARLLERNPGFVAAIEQSHPGPGAKAVLESTADFLSGLGTSGLKLGRVQCPVLYVVGAEDVMVLEEDRQVVRAVPDVQVEVLPGVPHQLERMPVDVLASLVREFLATG